jgi:predicted permease
MTWLRILALRWQSLFRKRRLEEELDEELRSHLEMLIEENLGKGMSSEEARYAARRSLGGVEQMKEVYREQRGLPMIETLFQDLRYGLRLLRRSPGFTVVAVLSIGLGIGANTAIFTLFDAVLLKSLPVKEPERLVQFLRAHSKGQVATFPYPEYEKYRDENQVCSGVAATFFLNPVVLLIDGQPGVGSGMLASGNYFSVLGVNAILGRTFTPADDRVPGTHPIAVISYGFWERRFGKDPSILGKSIVVNNTPLEIIGVTPPRFFGVRVGNSPDVMVPIMMQQPMMGRSMLQERGQWVNIFGRLRPGLTRQQAQGQLAVLFAQIFDDRIAAAPAEQRESIRKFRDQNWFELSPAATGLLSTLRKQFSLPLKILMVVVGIVLLIACTNVANLLLARATVRQREIAVRLAIGAGRFRIIRQLLTESVLMAAMGGLLGLLIAWWGSRFLLAMVSAGSWLVPIDVSPDTRVLGFTAALSVLTGILFGLVPALRSTHVDPGRDRSRAPGTGLRLGKLLVTLQVSLALPLLIGAGLFLRSLQNLWQLDLGFDRDNVLLFSIEPGQGGYRSEQARILTRQLLERISALPGVKSASVSAQRPLRGGWGYTVSTTGDTGGGQRQVDVGMDAVGPSYFRTMGARLVAGREFSSHDNEKSPAVAIVDENVAGALFGGEVAVGKRMRMGREREATIVGVVKNMKYDGVRSGDQQFQRIVYVPFFQGGLGGVNIEIRTADNPAGLIGFVQREVSALDKKLPLIDVKTLVAQVEESIVQERLIAVLSTFFGALALLLACIGLYGIMAYAVVRRTAEIGVRIALGARPGDVLWMVLRQTLLLVLLGIAAGLGAALAAARLVGSQLFGVTATDELTMATATLVLIAVAAVAGFIPARRASRVDPMVALRYE